jgi:hypothetical protein
MSYAGLGATIQAPTPTMAMVDVGVDRSPVNALMAHLNYLWLSSNRNPSMAPIQFAALYLKAIRPNAFSRLDPAKVAAALRQLTPETLTFVDRTIATPRTPTASAMVGYTVAKLLADISAGKFAGRAAPPTRQTLVANAAKLTGAVKTAAVATNLQTRAAARTAVLVQTQANDADLVAKAQAEKAAAAAEEARRADEASKAAQTAEADRVAKEAAAAAEAARGAANVATVVAADAGAAADQAQRDLEAVAERTNDTAAQEEIAQTTAEVAIVTSGAPLGVSWKIWGLGAAALVGGYFLLNSRAMAKNRRRVRRNRRHR